MKTNRIKTRMIGAFAFVVLFSIGNYSQETKQTNDIKHKPFFQKVN